MCSSVAQPSQRPRKDLSNKFLHQLLQHESKDLKSARTKFLHIGYYYIDFSKTVFISAEIVLQQVHSNSFYLLKKNPMWVILIFVDINPMVYRFSCCGSLGFSKDLLFKSILGSCAIPWLLSAGSFFFFFLFQ